MGAFLGVAAPEIVYRGDESSSSESESEGECERGPAGGDGTVSKDTERQSSKPVGAGSTTRSVMGTASKKSKAVSTMELLPGEKRGQCGLEDESDLEVYEPPRIRECQLKDEKKAKFKSHLDQIFSLDALLGKRLEFEPDDVMEVMLGVLPYLKGEPMLIEDVPFDVVVVGDLHGQLYDLERIFGHYGKDGKPGWESRKFVFLGNYIDRGRQSLEIIMALFCLKMLHPDRIWLLRGNHEFVEMNCKHGFQEEIQMRYNFQEDPAKMLYFMCNTVFAYLSVGAIVGDTYLCVHAGISPRHFTRRSLKGTYKPIIHADKDVLVNDMVWSDPAPGLDGVCHNAARETSIYFGMKALVVALSSIRCKAMFRGHSWIKSGFETNWSLCHTIFSATNYRNRGNKGAVADIDAKGKVSFCVMEIDPKRTELMRAIRELTCEFDSEEEEERKAVASKAEKVPRKTGKTPSKSKKGAAKVQKLQV